MASPGGGGISGIGVAVVTLGGFLMFVGVRDVPIVEGLREITSGKKPTSRPKTPTNVEYVIPPSGGGGNPGGGTGGSEQISNPGGGGNSQWAQEASKHLGVPYLWGGSTPRGFDCSGLVQYVAARVTGLRQASIPRTTYTQVLWNQLQTIPRSAVGAGDLLFWSGHVGIAISNTQLIHAPRPGTLVRTEAIDRAGPGGRPPTVCKRYKGTAALPTPTARA